MNKKKLLLIILPILLVLIIAGALAVLYFATDIFKSDKDLFAKYFVQNGEVFDILENANIDKQNEFKKKNTYTSDGELLVTIENGTNTQEVKASTASRYDSNTERFYSEMTLKNGEADLLKVSYINSNDVYAIKCEDILANYIGIRNSDLKAFARNMGLSESEIEIIPDSIDFDSINNILQLTEEQKQHIIDTYSKVIIESIPEEKFAKLEKTKISVDGTNYESNVYQLVLDENTMNQIIINCLNTLKDDNTTLVIISNIFTNLGLGTEYTDITAISKVIEEQVTEMQNAEYSTSNGTITIKVYVHNKQTIKTEILLLEEEKNIAQISIDKTKANNTQKAIITIDNYVSGIMDSSLSSFENSDTTSKESYQITLQKTVTDTSIMNDIIFIPDTTSMEESITINKVIGNIQNNMFNNTSDVTISTSSDGNNVETISSYYTQNVQAVAQVEEIMELKNSNTVIINNYTVQQLTPFLTNIGNKISEVIPNKIAQLGITTNTNQNANMSSGTSNDIINNFNTNITDTSNIASISDNIIKYVKLIGSAGVSIADVNGVDIWDVGNIIVIGAARTSMTISNNMANSILESEIQQEEAEKMDEEIEANTQAYIDQYMNTIISNSDVQ